MDSASGDKLVYVKVTHQSGLAKISPVETPKVVLNLSKVHSVLEKGEASGLSILSKSANSQDCASRDSEQSSEVEADSSDTLSSGRDEASGEEELGKFQMVLSKRQRMVQRGKSLKHS